MSLKSSKSIELDSRAHLKGLSVSIYLFADTLNVEGGTVKIDTAFQYPGCPLCAPHGHPRIHVCWRGEELALVVLGHAHVHQPGERGPRAVARLPQDCREVEDQGAGGGNPGSRRVGG